ncbi:hypothetical protein ACFWM5_00640 [Streptomyces bobili]|uniref:hypothetical protein n=1 Tax=Streptomyces bobili TaxID=67280 RepID=UPI00365FEFAA
MERLTFTLAGRDELTRVMNGTADSADRLRLRMAGITGDADGRLRDLQGRMLSTADAERRLTDRTDATRAAFRNLSDSAGKLGEAVKANLISLAPAAIPAAAGLAGAAGTLAAQFGAVALSAAAYGLALGPQIAAIGEATAAQDKYEEAVRTSGATSAEAVKAQLAYQQALAKLPPETRKAAVAVGLLKDNFKEWSDELSGDVMGPFTKGVAVTNALLPTTTGLVKGASTQFDRLITMVGGAISTPGFDALNTRVTNFADRTLDHAVDELTVFLAKLDAGEYSNSGFSEFLDYSKANGPAVFDTLENIGEALLNVLEAGSDVGVGMLDVINALSGIVSAVPPGAIATLLQLAIAIKAVRLAAAGTEAARAALLALGTQVGAMRVAAAGAPSAIGGVTAAIAGLSRGAKLALAGTGIGLLLITLDALSSRSKEPKVDVDKLATSVVELGRTGKVSGESLRAYGTDLGGLSKSLRELSNRSGFESFLQGWGEFLGMDSTEVADAKKEIDGLDKSLASLVSQGRAQEAAAGLEMYIEKMGLTKKEAADLRERLNDYSDSLAGQALEQQLAAESMGLFGQQAQEVQVQLDEQKASTDGLRQSIVALNEVNRQGLDAQADFEASIDSAAEAATEYGNVWRANGGTLDLTTEKGRGAYRALSDLAAKTNEATTAGRESGASWSEVNRTFEKGREQLIKNAMQMGLTKQAAAALAEQILKTPNKTAQLKGNLEDLKVKLAEAKTRLAKAPSSKTAKIKGEIEDLKRKIRDAQAAINGMTGRTLAIHVAANMDKRLAAAGLLAQGGPVVRRAQGGPIPGFPGGGLLSGPGTSTSDSILLWGSDGEYMIKAASVTKYGRHFMDAVNEGRLPVGRAAPRAGLPAAPVASPAGAAADGRAVTYNVYPRASVINVEDLRLLQRQEEAHQRVGRPR